MSSSSSSRYFKEIRNDNGPGGDRKLSFDVHGIDLAVVNAIRRTVLADVPSATMRFTPYEPASNGINIATNTSALHNEMLGHRLSLVPVCVTENELAALAANKEHLKFKLHVKNTSDRVLNVTTEDFKVYDKGVLQPDKVREDLFPACPISKRHILLLKLRPSSLGTSEGEELVLDAQPSVGTGSQHACFCPVSICFFTNKKDAAACDVAFAKQLQGLRQSREEAGLAAPSPEEVAELRRSFDALDAQRCFVTNKRGDPCVFEFRLESECRLRPAFLIFKAIDILRNKVARIRDALQASNADVVAVKPYGNTAGLFHMILRGESHTIGNLLQTLMYIKYIRDATEMPATSARQVLDFVGYNAPHPLEQYVIVQLKMAAGKTLAADVEQFVISALDWMTLLMGALCKEWYQASGMKDYGIAEVETVMAALKDITSTDVLAELGGMGEEDDKRQARKNDAVQQQPETDTAQAQAQAQEQDEEPALGSIKAKKKTPKNKKQQAKSDKEP
jgi:DNA-directed RNA polymerase subunit L